VSNTNDGVLDDLEIGERGNECVTSDDDDDDDDDDENDDTEGDDFGDNHNESNHESREVQFLESREEVISLLYEAGLYNHFKNESGSKYQTESQAQQGCKRVADFLCWAFNDCNESEFLKKSDALEYFAIILNEDYKQFRRYTNYLSDKRKLAPSTVKNYFTDIKSAAYWRAYDYRCETDLSIINLGGLEMIAKSIQK
jgi:hypothetical protein